jgi:hypothetical protein
MVPKVGLEPTHLSILDFESSASTIPPLRHYFLQYALYINNP